MGDDRHDALAAGGTPAQLQSLTDLGTALTAASAPLAAAIAATNPQQATAAKAKVAALKK